MLEITKVFPNTIAQELGILKGDVVLKINAEDINDQLDYRFFSAEESIELLIQREEEQLLFEIDKDFNEDIGLELQEMKMKACGNNCIFCFVYQNPKGMRKALYFKDEDYRFSFLYGHYVTLTTVNREDLERIVKQKLSPLYISVHSTEESTRKLLLGIKRDDHLLEKIEYLVEGGIELHTQIVLCPGINDGKIFDQTVEDLKRFYPGVKSIAIVPLGLTSHRDNLYQLRIHSKSELKKMIEYSKKVRQNMRDEIGSSFIYLADEFFIKADSPFPDADYYEDFYQIENGVGEFRQLIDHFDQNFKSMPKQISSPLTITWVTGELAADSLNKFIISKLNEIENVKINLFPIRNNFYGPDISVSGLLVGRDIYEQLEGKGLGDLILLPPRILNPDGLLLDDWTVKMLEDKLKVPCYVYSEFISDLINVITNLRMSA